MLTRRQVLKHGKIFERKPLLDENNKVLKKGYWHQRVECNEIMLTEIINQDFFLKDKTKRKLWQLLAAFLEENNDVTSSDSLDINENVRNVTVILTILQQILEIMNIIQI